MSCIKRLRPGAELLVSSLFGFRHPCCEQRPAGTQVSHRDLAHVDTCHKAGTAALREPGGSSTLSHFFAFQPQHLFCP